jgi:hypothetical protein
MVDKKVPSKCANSFTDRALTLNLNQRTVPTG